MKSLRKLLCLALTVVMALGLCSIAVSADGGKASVSTFKLNVDGEAVECEKYLIDGANYFKLRDLATLLSGTKAQFEVGYDVGTKIVSVTTGKAYTPVGGELATSVDRSATVYPSEWKLFVDGKEVDCEIYNIGWNNYFKLRDVGKAVGFNVYWDGAVEVESDKAYTGEAPDNLSDYTLLATIYDYRDYISADDTRSEWDLVYAVNFESPEFSKYFKDGDGKTGLAEIIKAGNVYVNGYRIPYVMEDGTYSSTDFKINDSSNVWQVDADNDLWGWQLHMYYQYSGGPMGALSGIKDYVAGQAVSFETAINYYVKYLSNIYGQPVYLYAKTGENYVSRIETTRLNTSIVGGVTDNGDGTTTLAGTSGDAIQTFKTANVDSSIKAGDGIIFYEEKDTGWVAKRAYAITSYLVENLDDYHSPWIYVNGENLSTGDTLADKDFAEAYRHTQFIRGYRRTRQFDEKTAVTMWCMAEDGYSFGFTYPEASARAALEYAVKYTSEYADTLKISADGTDVAATDYWVTQEAMDTYTAALAKAKELLTDKEGKTNAATIFEYNEMILTLADAFGGTEGNVGPGANNSLGIFGSAKPGTKA